MYARRIEGSDEDSGDEEEDNGRRFWRFAQCQISSAVVTTTSLPSQRAISLLLRVNVCVLVEFLERKRINT